LKAEALLLLALADVVLELTVVAFKLVGLAVVLLVADAPRVVTRVRGSGM
jgi:hypothetical protein